MIVMITGAFPRGEDKGGSAPKDLIEFGEGQIIVGEAEKKILSTPSVFLPPPLRFFPYIFP